MIRKKQGRLNKPKSSLTPKETTSSHLAAASAQP